MKPDYDEAAWADHTHFTAYWQHKDHPGSYAWYRVRFTGPKPPPGQRLRVSLGRIFGADRTYLNGKRIGQTGRFPPAKPDPKVRGLPRVYDLPATLLREGKSNVLAVCVYDAGTRGGRRDLPYLLYAPK